MSAPVIKFSPSKKQFEAYERLTDATTSYIGYGGSAFSGKSYLLCYWLTIMCIAYPDTGWGLCRKELTTLKKTTLLTLFKVFAECGIQSVKHYNYNQQLNYITFWNGSMIFLIDTDYKPSDPLYTRLGGYELTGAAIDESAETKSIAIDIISTRIGRRKNEEYGLAAKMLETFNPDKGHVYQRYYKPWKDSVTIRTDGVKPPKMTDGYVFIKALPSDNPSPEVPAYVERIRSTGDKVTIARLIDGDFEYDDDPLKLYNYDKILEMFTNDHVTSPPNKYLTADIAYEGSDLFVIGIWNDLVLEHIEAFEKCDETQVAAKIQQARMKYGVPIAHCIYDADGLKTFVRQSAKVGSLVGAVPFHNGGKALNGENYFNLKAQCAFKLRDVMDENRIYIRAKEYRKQIIEECEQIKKMNRYDDKEPLRLEKKSDLKERLLRSPDFFDMINMRMYFELKPKTSTTKNWASAFA